MVIGHLQNIDTGNIDSKRAYMFNKYNSNIYSVRQVETLIIQILTKDLRIITVVFKNIGNSKQGRFFVKLECWTHTEPGTIYVH